MNLLPDLSTDECEEIELDITALAFLQHVYRSPNHPLSVRMRAAAQALPFEAPRLSVVASISDPAAFAERLERAIARSGVRPLMLEAKVIDAKPAPSQPGDVTGAMLATERKGRRL